MYPQELRCGEWMKLATGITFLDVLGNRITAPW